MVDKKVVTFDGVAREAISKGAWLLAKVVAVTLGPRGRTVMIEKNGSVIATKDGVSVAREVVLENSVENVGAQLLLEVASQTADLSGDGTTTAVVLANEMIQLGMKATVAGVDPMLLRAGMEKAAEVVACFVRKLGRSVSGSDMIAQVATISANNDSEIGDIIARGLKEVGQEGVISIGEGKSIDTVLEVVKGMQLSKGYLSPYFITDHEKAVCELEDAFVLLVEKKITSVTALVTFLEKFSSEKGSKPLLIVAEDVESEAIALLVVNKVKGGMPLCAIKAPDFGDRRKQKLEDLAILTGAQIIAAESGLSLEGADLSILGRVERVRIAKEDTVFVGGAGNKKDIEERCQQIRNSMAMVDSSYERDAFADRLAKLQDGVAVICVGAATEAEARERKDRIEDALHATRAAIREGVVAGGGVALIRAVSELNKLEASLSGDIAVGVRIVRQACLAPARQIADNCGQNGAFIVGKIAEHKDSSWGYNGLTDAFGDMFEMAVMDPVTVVAIAMTKAVSVAGLVLTSGCVVTESKETSSEQDQEDGLY